MLITIHTGSGQGAQEYTVPCQHLLFSYQKLMPRSLSAIAENVKPGDAGRVLCLSFIEPGASLAPLVIAF